MHVDASRPVCVCNSKVVPKLLETAHETAKISRLRPRLRRALGRAQIKNPVASRGGVAVSCPYPPRGLCGSVRQCLYCPHRARNRPQSRRNASTSSSPKAAARLHSVFTACVRGRFAARALAALAAAAGPQRRASSRTRLRPIARRTPFYVEGACVPRSGMSGVWCQAWAKRPSSSATGCMGVNSGAAPRTWAALPAPRQTQAALRPTCDGQLPCSRRAFRHCG